MIVLDEPYVSEPLIEWLQQSQHPVLDNAMAQRLARVHGGLNCVSAEEAIKRLDAGERVYTNSENALSWIVENTHNESLSRAIGMFKDKARMRTELASLDPEFFFKACSVDELFNLDFETLPTSFILKPSVGFCSMGVYAIQCREDWDRALADLSGSAASWGEMYPESVIGSGMFVLEGYIEGTEYALDAYFDEQGSAHILNILRHDFLSPEDTSDRMYVTSAAIVRENEALFVEWLDKVNALVGAKNFPVHVEVRVDKEQVRAIEFNPLRFAGLGGTDISYYAYGYRTYEAFLEDKRPDFGAVFAGKEDNVYTMSLLNPAADADVKAPFDYEAFESRFSRVLELRHFDVAKVGNYGFLFIETNKESADELEFLHKTDLKEFLR